MMVADALTHRSFLDISSRHVISFQFVLGRVVTKNGHTKRGFKNFGLGHGAGGWCLGPIVTSIFKKVTDI